MAGRAQGMIAVSLRLKVLQWRRGGATVEVKRNWEIMQNKSFIPLTS